MNNEKIQLHNTRISEYRSIEDNIELKTENIQNRNRDDTEYLKILSEAFFRLMDMLINIIVNLKCLR